MSKIYCREAEKTITK